MTDRRSTQALAPAATDTADLANRPVRLYPTLLLALAAVSIVITAAELAIARHWDGLAQWVPWALLGVALVAVGLLLVRPDRSRVNLARMLGVIVIAGALFGVFKHIDGNYQDGASPQGYGPEWESTSETERWWKAANGSVGGMAPLAPLALAFSGILVLGVTLNYPGSRRSQARIEQRDALAEDRPPRRRAS